MLTLLRYHQSHRTIYRNYSTTYIQNKNKKKMENEQTHDEDDIIEDELWENQKREGSSGIWLPAMDRGKFSDRFGKYKYRNLKEVPVPKNSRIIEDFQIAHTNWSYGKSFTNLESNVAKGISRGEKWNFSYRWRRWVRRRLIVTENSISNCEVLSGWLGIKERRGTWKSRYFILVGFVSGGNLIQNTQGVEGDAGSDDPSSSSEEEGEFDVEDDVDTDRPTIVPALHEPPGVLLVEEQLVPPPTTTGTTASFSTTTPLLYYIRRGYDDTRGSLFPFSIVDWNEIRSLTKKVIRKVKLSNKMKIIDDFPENPGRFALKFPGGRRRIFNALTSDVKDRWLDVFRSLLEDNSQETSPSIKQRGGGRLAAAIEAAKRGQQELRRGFSLRRLSQGDRSQNTLSVQTQLTQPPVHIVEMFRSSSDGALNIRLAEQQTGKGLFVENIFDLAREMNGHNLNLFVGDNIVAVQGESLIGLETGMALQTLQNVLGRTPIKERISLTIAKPSCVYSPPGSKGKNKSLFPSSPPPPIAANTTTAIISRLNATNLSDDSEREDEGFESLKHIDPTNGNNNNNNNNNIKSGFQRMKQPRRVEVPVNNFGMVSATVRQATLKCLERMLGEEQSVVITYAQLRNQVALDLAVGNKFDNEEWRLWFRDFLDFWVCDGIKYSTGGLDVNDFTPVIQKIES